MTTPFPPPSVVVDANARVLPELAEVYRAAASEFTDEGAAVLKRSLAKGSLGGENASALAFLPASLLAFSENTEILAEIFDITTHVPWLHWTLMLPIRGFRCLLLQRLEAEGDPRADAVRTCAVFAPSGLSWTSPRHGMFPTSASRIGEPEYTRSAVTRLAARPAPTRPRLNSQMLGSQIAYAHLLAQLAAYRGAGGDTPASAPRVDVRRELDAVGERVSYLLTRPITRRDRIASP